MRTFSEVFKTLDLEEFLDSDKGTLYCGPSAPAPPTIMVRHFDGYFTPDLVQPFASVTAAAGEWIDKHHDVAKFVELEKLTEVGLDFVSRPFHVYSTSLSIYVDKLDDPEAPQEIGPMRQAVLKETGHDKDPKTLLIEKVLAKSVMGPAGKTFFDWSTHKFCIVELSLSRNDLLSWKSLEHGGEAED